MDSTGASGLRTRKHSSTRARSLASKQQDWIGLRLESTSLPLVQGVVLPPGQRRVAPGQQVVPIQLERPIQGLAGPGPAA